MLTNSIYITYVALKESESAHHIMVKPQLEEIHEAIQNPKPQEVSKNAPKDKIENNSTNFFENFIDIFSEGMKSTYHLVKIYRFSRGAIKRNYIRINIFDFAENNLDKIEETSGFSIYGVKRDKIHNFQKSLKEFDRLSDGVDTLPNAVIMALVSLFDAHLSYLVRNLIGKYPRQAGLGAKTIDVSLVLKAASIDELKESIIEDQIYHLMRGSHDDQIAFMERFGRKIRESKDYPLFLEVFERRNLAAHGEGFANARYIEKCRQYSVPSGSYLNLSEPLNLNPLYLNESIDRLYEFDFLTAWWLWTKLEAAEIENAYSKAVEISYDLLTEERYSLAERIISSVLSRDEGNFFEIQRRMLCLNRIIALKSLEDEEWKKESTRFGWDAVDNRFRAAIAAIHEDCKAVCELMPQLTSDETIGEDGFRNWPVFRWVRQNDEYQEKFFEVFGSRLRADEEIAKAS